MENTALDALICPVCGLEFIESLPGETALKCVDGHSFDIAKQGYINLLTGKGTKFQPDTAPMVAARDDFLDAGHYEPLANELSTLVRAALGEDATARCIVDAGTGTGYYLQRIMASLASLESDVPGSRVDAIAMDISKFALRRAARRNSQAANLVWDLWQPFPLEANLADVVLVIFAPRNSAEFARVLKPGGTLLVVTPLPGHLAEIAGPTSMLGIQAEKETALVKAMSGEFELTASHDVIVPLSLSAADVHNVALMGPAGHHLDPADLDRTVASLPEVNPTTAAFRISVFRPGRTEA